MAFDPKSYAIERIQPYEGPPEGRVIRPTIPGIPAPTPDLREPGETAPEVPIAQPPTTVVQSLPVTKTISLLVHLRPIINFGSQSDTITVRVSLSVMLPSGDVRQFVREYVVGTTDFVSDIIPLTEGDLIAAAVQATNFIGIAGAPYTYCSLHLIGGGGNYLIQTLLQGFVDHLSFLSWPSFTSFDDHDRGYALVTDPGPTTSFTIDASAGYRFYPVAFSADCLNTSATNTLKLAIYGADDPADGPIYARSRDLLPSAQRIIKASPGLSEPSATGLEEIMPIAASPVPVRTILVRGVPAADIRMSNLRLWLRYIAADTA